MLILGDENECKSFPFVNLTIIFACTFITAMVFADGNAEAVLRQYGCVPARFLAHQNWEQIYTLLSSTFLHAGLLHLVGNMWFLFIFGDNVEDHFGHFNYAIFYLTCGIIAALAQLASEPSSMTPCVGASGAIAGVLGAYIILFPNAKVKTYWGDDSLFFAFRTYHVPAVGVIGFWFVMQYICMQMHVPGIGWHAHIFGFLTGMAIVYLYRMCDEKCSDNDAINHNGGYTMQSYAHSRGSFQDSGSASPSIAKPMLAIVLAGALTTCGTFYLLQRSTAKPQTSTASSTSSIATKPAKTDAASNQKKSHAVQKSRHSKTNSRNHNGHKRASVVS